MGSLLIFRFGVEGTTEEECWWCGISPARLIQNTLPNFTIAPEKLPSQKESSLPTINFGAHVEIISDQDAQLDL